MALHHPPPFVTQTQEQMRQSDSPAVTTLKLGCKRKATVIRH